MLPLWMLITLWPVHLIGGRALDPGCLADVHEPNDRRAQARLAHGVIEGVLCPGDVDWFTVPLEPGHYAVTLEKGADARLAWHPPRRRRPLFGLREVGRARRLAVRSSGRHKVSLRGGSGHYVVRISPVEARP